MSESKKTAPEKPVDKQDNKDKSYPTEKLLKSKEFSGYQQDFARAILKKSSYTIREARDALDSVLNKK